jgi:hypothetical protein
MIIGWCDRSEAWDHRDSSKRERERERERERVEEVVGVLTNGAT